MSSADLISLLPLIILAGAPVVIMLVVAFFRNHLLTATLTVLSFAAAFLSMFPAGSYVPRSLSGLLIIDDFGWFYLGLLILTGLFVALMSYSYLHMQRGNRGEFYLLLLIGTLGACVLALSRHMVSFFMGIEVLSIALYTLIAYPRNRSISIEGAVKYLILAAASSAMLLFGFALLYAETGTMEFFRLGQVLQENPASLITIGGIGLVLTGIGFKLAVVPFHWWSPDVYQGAPAPVTAFIATVSKGGALAVLLRFFHSIGGVHNDSLVLVITIIAIASMLGGNLMALLQKDVKRMLAYSSIAHLGYILVAFLAGGESGIQSATFYIVVYIITILTAFGVVALFSTRERDAGELEDYSGMFWQYPWLGLVFTAALLSLAGIPLTAGFIGKYFLLLTGIGSGLWLLSIVLVISSVIGLFYYLRIIVQMVSKPHETTGISPVKLTLAGTVIVSLITVLIVWFGIYPTDLLDLISRMVVL